jgi:nucleoside-diphosphate-sugar epimerase
MNALIGHSGFVGGNLLACRSYDALFRSTDIASIRGREFEHVVCAGIQAMKWWANLHPEEDLAGIDRLLDALSDVKVDRFTLISTIDVYPSPRGVDEDTPIKTAGHHAYGLHRLYAEQRIAEMFPRTLVLRLPGLFGPGLKKNVIYDLIHANNLHQVHPGGVFQYYDLRRLADDIDKAWSLGCSTLNISSGPLGTSEIRDRFFPGKALGGTGTAPSGYDMRSKHAAAWAESAGYLYSKEQVLSDLGDWLACERVAAS